VLLALVPLLALQVAAQKLSAKRGLAFNDPSLLYQFAVAESQVSWSFDWYSATWENPPSLEFVPMLWCSTDQALLDAWKNNAQSIIDHSPLLSTHLLAFQEPDNEGQCNITPLFAAATYIVYFQPYKGSALLGAPAVSSKPGGLQWLSEFLYHCQGCEINFVPIHWYGSALDVEGFYSYVAQAYAAAQNRPIWITEVSHDTGPRMSRQF
jgi:hypothetical protein